MSQALKRRGCGSGTSPAEVAATWSLPSFCAAMRASDVPTTHFRKWLDGHACYYVDVCRKIITTTTRQLKVRSSLPRRRQFRAASSRLACPSIVCENVAGQGLGFACSHCCLALSSRFLSHASGVDPTRAPLVLQTPCSPIFTPYRLLTSPSLRQDQIHPLLPRWPMNSHAGRQGRERIDGETGMPKCHGSVQATIRLAFSPSPVLVQ